MRSLITATCLIGGFLGLVCACLVSLAELRQTTAAADHWRDAYLRAAAESRALHADLRHLREFRR